VQAEEFPENRYKVDKEDIIKYEKKLRREARRKEAEAKHMNAGGFGGFGGTSAPKAEDDEGEDSDAETQVQAQAPANEEEPAAVKEGDSTEQVEPLNALLVEANAAVVEESSSLSELELYERRAHHEKLKYEKESIMQKIEKTVMTFDEALDELRREKFKLEADLKTTDMRMLVLYQELVLLKEFEKKDNMLAKKLEAKRIEKADIVAKIGECQERLAVKKTEIEGLLERDKAIVSEFNGIVGEQNKQYDALLKVFKKKIKRIKKKTRAAANGQRGGDNGGSSESEEEEEDDQDLDEMSDDGEINPEDEDTCPPGCDQHVYDQVCELRERRLDHEDLLSDFQKSIEALRKENEALVKKEKVIDSGLHSVENEIQAFQTEKQRKLNELHVVITLKMHQIQCLVDGRLPDDLSQCLVFTNAGLRKLRDRIKELQQEKINLRKQQKELRKQHANLARTKKEKEGKIAELEARAYDVQMLKFGQVIDLEVLERMSVNRTAEELKEKLKRQEAKNVAELDSWDLKVRQATDRLAAATRRNTELLQMVAELSQQEARLENALNSTQNALVAEFAPSTTKDTKERQKLMDTVRIQAREIDALRAEIQMLRRKGGHVYMPVAPPRKSYSPPAS